MLPKLIALFSLTPFSSLANNNVNPFNSQQQLLHNVVNPFQANNNNNNNSTQQHQQQQQNLYGQLTLIPNGYGSSPLQGQQLLQPTSTTGSANFFNFNNNGFAVSQGLPNGCGFGSMQPTPVMAGGINGAYNNPFAVSLLNPPNSLNVLQL